MKHLLKKFAAWLWVYSSEDKSKRNRRPPKGRDIHQFLTPDELALAVKLYDDPARDCYANMICEQITHHNLHRINRSVDAELRQPDPMWWAYLIERIMLDAKAHRLHK